MNEIVGTQSKPHVERVNIHLSNTSKDAWNFLGLIFSKLKKKAYNQVSDRIKLFYKAACMESILLNFLTNTIKYRHPKRPLVIVIEALEKENELLLIIKDNGRGIN